MNLLRNLKISHKLGLLVLISLIGFAAIGGVYFTVLQLQDGAKQQSTKAEAVVYGTGEIDNQLAELRRTAQAFFDNPEAVHINNFNSLKENIKQQLANFSRIIEAGRDGHDATAQSLTTTLQEHFTAFVQAFELVAATSTTIGFDQSSGTQGAMHAAAGELETLLASVEVNSDSTGSISGTWDKKIDSLELVKLMLTMQRHEKDYIQQKDDEYIDRFTDTWGQFKEKLDESTLLATEQDPILAATDEYFFQFLALIENSIKLDDEVADVRRREQALGKLLGSVATASQADLEASRAELDTSLTFINQIFAATLAGVALIVILAAALIASGIFRSVRRLQGAVQQVAAGNTDARARMLTGDELGQLGNAFDHMLDERAADLAKVEQETEQLNNSVIQLLDATARLADRDLTARAPVTEDITGNISDALNQMAEETASVMTDITGLAGQLEKSATIVGRQSAKVSDVAATERQVVDQALAKLQQSTDTMGAVADLALNSDQLAEKAGQSAKRALLAVRNTVRSINDIRSSVGETEKGIKRLGERSQEIGSIVEIIRDIADRTHTLALNAGMQAVAAGDAGKGFSVVADEVQRLAETARESTDQIGTLVRSIQAEASETMSTMNKTIDQVVQGSDLAEKAGKRMRLTRRSTEELVTAVQQIAEQSKTQAVITAELREQAAELQLSTAATEQELREQNAQTENMFQYLTRLVQSVQVFKLSDAAQAEESPADKAAA